MKHGRTPSTAPWAYTAISAQVFVAELRWLTYASLVKTRSSRSATCSPPAAAGGRRGFPELLRDDRRETAVVAGCVEFFALTVVSSPASRSCAYAATNASSRSDVLSTVPLYSPLSSWDYRVARRPTTNTSNASRTTPASVSRMVTRRPNWPLGWNVPIPSVENVSVLK